MCIFTTPHRTTTRLASALWLLGYQDLWKNASEVIASDPRPRVSVCMGGDWYTFPSHFFLPDNARLTFVNDTFHGQLPQLYNENGREDGMRLGTFVDPEQPFNDENREVPERYMPYSQCDYAVATIHHSTSTRAEAPFVRFLQTHDEEYELMISKHVINAAESQSLARAFLIPFYSIKRISFSSYSFYRRINKTD